ncbi:hypothetical protein PDG61_08720 [Mycolicibacterium sp. BiH015]|uniref:hypothetical protein n=1 Tax=Mycolicibacterium sp. BiH015 TaxID=3018808 RepID=UPI0022E8E0BD|nr:hypothetical protein [Mycolicibacterium sp. BiH015]MDA2890991.1 hypothetical protein [Mycolicibacterium sp. BiH015]
MSDRLRPQYNKRPDIHSPENDFKPRSSAVLPPKPTWLDLTAEPISEFEPQPQHGASKQVTQMRPGRWTQARIPTIHSNSLGDEKMKRLIAFTTIAAFLAASPTAQADPQSDAVWAYKNGGKVCTWFAGGVDSLSIEQAVDYVAAFGLQPETVQTAVMWNCPEHFADVAGYLANYSYG